MKSKKSIVLFKNDNCRVVMRHMGGDTYETIFEKHSGFDTAGERLYQPVPPDSVEHLRCVADAFAQDQLKKHFEEERRREEESLRRGGPGDR